VEEGVVLDDIRADIDRVTYQEPRLLKKLAVALLHPGLHSVLFYRLSRWFYLHRMGAVSAFINYVSYVITGAQISHKARIGKGLAIYHPSGVVIGATAVLGEDCVLVHNNVIGQLHGDGDRPVIGDRLFAATGAKMLGKVQIGSGVTIGPNAVVVDSLPDGVTAAGNPARIVRRRQAPDVAPGNAEAVRPLTRVDGSVLARVLAAIKRSVEVPASVDGINKDTVLLGEGIGLDSLELLRIINEIEAEFDLTIDESELSGSELRTVGSLAAFIEERISYERPTTNLRRAG
jgi:serine O-acetyltransferase